MHRDIKPENVLLSGGTAGVTDFGIAKAMSLSRDQWRALIGHLEQADPVLRPTVLVARQRLRADERRAGG